MPREFLSPVGRLVQGSVLEASTTDNKGQPLLVKTGPNKGQPTQSAFIAVAYEKMIRDPQTGQMVPNAEFNTFYGEIYAEGREGYPQHFNPDGTCKHPRFAFKVMDGDGLDNDGNPNNAKTGFAGCWVVKFSSTFVPKAWMNGAYTVDPNAIKKGYYVRVTGSMRPNIGSDVPGVYLNHNGVEFIAYGEEILSGPNVGAVFSTASKPTYMPAGASFVPPTPTVSAMPAPGAGPALAPPPVAGPAAGLPAGMPAPVNVAQQSAAMPGLPAMPASMPAPGGITPNHGFVQNVIGGPAAMPPAMAPIAPPAGPVYQMTALAGGFTREQYHAQKWTDEALLAGGQMVRVS